MNIALRDGERLNYINENLSLIEYEGGLTFGTDAYLLAAFVKGNYKCCADLGSGTGVASLLCLARNKYGRAVAAEIQPRYAELIKRNAELNGFSAKVKVFEGDIRELGPDFTDGEIDCVISNPPYLKSTEGFATKTTEMNIARREMNGTIYDFAKTASRLLKYGGVFYTVFRPDRLSELIHALKENNLEPKRLVCVYPDTASKPCLVLVESKKGASPTMLHSLPLFIYKDGTRDYTENMTRVYDECSLEFLF